MPLSVILLISITAFTHSGWNLLCKSRTPSAAFFLIVVACAVVLLSPVYFFEQETLMLLDRNVWLLILCTGIVQTIYYICLANAYRLAEMSIAYPITRSLPVLIIPMVTAILNLGRALTYVAIYGMVLIFCGCVFLPLPHFRKLFRLWEYCNWGLLCVFAAACCTVGYTIIDNEALKAIGELKLEHLAAVLDATGGTDVPAAKEPSSFLTALLYMALEFSAIGIFLSLYVFLFKPERKALRTIAGQSFTYPIAAGAMSAFDYTLILTAMTMVPNVSYVAAFRQLSIPVGAIMGMVFLKESHAAPKLVGLALIVTGLVMVACG